MTLDGRQSAAPQPDLPPGWWKGPDYVPPPPAPVSWDDYFAWLKEDSHAEWVDGEITELDPSTAEHQALTGFLLCLLWLTAERHDPRSRVLSRFMLRLRSRPSAREPDLTFVTATHAERVTTYYIDGPSDLVVEVVSDDSVTRDYREKLAEYQTAGIPEYWIIDPLRKEARFYQLGEGGTYRLGPIDEDGVYTSPVVAGFRLRVSWLWQRPMPTIDEALTDLPE